jgi:hypothetical protein
LRKSLFQQNTGTAKVITITYNSSVFTPAGWRGVVVTAKAELLSAKRAEVVEVVDIDGEGAVGYASRTGAKRQQYNVGGTAKREVGAVKVLSKCISVVGE